MITMNLDTLIRILLARKKIIILFTLGILILTTAVTLMLPKTYTASTDLLVDSKGQDLISGQALPTRIMTGYLSTQADIILSRNVAEKVIDQLNLSEEPSLIKQLRLENKDKATRRLVILGYLKRNLSALPKRESSVLTISFNARNPALAAKIADTFAIAYLQTNLEMRIEPAKQMTLWFDQQLAQLRNTLIEKQNALSAYQEKNNILVSDDRLDIESAKLSELSSMLMSVQSERLSNKNRSDLIASSGRNAAPALDNPQVQKLYSDLVQSQAKLSELASNVGQNHPQYRQTLGEVESIQLQLNKALELVNGNLRSSIELSQTREAQLKNELAAQKNRVLQLSRNRNELTLLKQEVDSAQSAYTTALSRTSQTHLESQIAQTDISVLDHAEIPGQPTSPKLFFNLLLAIVVGLLFGTSAALIWEVLDRRIRGLYDLEKAIGIAVLAAIPMRHDAVHTEG